MISDMPKLNKVLRDIREKRGLSTRKLGKMIDVSGQSVSRFESGEIREPAEYIKKIWFMLDEDERKLVEAAWIEIALEKIR